MQIKDSVSFCIFLTTSMRSQIFLKGMELQGGRLGLEPLLFQLWSARGRSENKDHLSLMRDDLYFKFSDHQKTKFIPKSSANAVVVVSVAGLVTVVVKHWPSTKSP